MKQNKHFQPELKIPKRIITKKEIREIIKWLPMNSPEEDFKMVYEMGYKKGILSQRRKSK